MRPQAPKKQPLFLLQQGYDLEKGHFCAFPLSA